MASEPQSPEAFVRLFSRHEARIHAYILTMVPNWADAADILQETSAVLWRKFEQFEPDTNFFAWACQVARLEVHSFRKRNRHQALAFSDEFIEAVAERATTLADQLEARQALLADCMEKLRSRDREMLRLRYVDGSSIDAVAKQTGRTMEAVYKALQRVRRQLFECTERAVEEGRS
jgi:RNA polymerase sigma-70 factor (ECF subfamily)